MTSKDTNIPEVSKTILNLFPIQQKPIELTYSGEKISSDGGLLILKEIDNQIGIIEGLKNCRNVCYRLY